MSMIVYKDGVLAADTQSSVNDMIVSVTARKIHRLPDGSLLGYTGRVDRGQTFLRWAERGFEPSETPPAVDNEADFAGIVIGINGSIAIYHNDMSVLDGADIGWCALGVGFEFAFALHTLGWTAEQIIAHAIIHCEGVGGTVYSLRLDGWDGVEPISDADFEEVEPADLDAAFAEPTRKPWTDPPPDEAITQFLKDRGLE